MSDTAQCTQCEGTIHFDRGDSTGECDKCCSEYIVHDGILYIRCA